MGLNFAPMMDPQTPSDDALVDLRELARRDARMQGRRALAAMPRLAAALAEAPGERQAQWSLHGFVQVLPGGGSQPMAELEVRAVLALQCQRCLRTVEVPVDEHALFRLVDVEPELSMDELEAQDEALCATAPVDLHALVEDQLILALPLVPMHASCAPPAAPDASVDTSVDTSPFAVLQRLRPR